MEGMVDVDGDVICGPIELLFSFDDDAPPLPRACIPASKLSTARGAAHCMG